MLQFDLILTYLDAGHTINLSKATTTINSARLAAVLKTYVTQEGQKSTVFRIKNDNLLNCAFRETF